MSLNLNIHISSEFGRIGNLWWVNSSTIPVEVDGVKYVRWGCLGWGKLILRYKEI